MEEEEKLWSPDMILSTVTPSSTSNIPSRERRREWVEEREEGEDEGEVGKMAPASDNPMVMERRDRGEGGWRYVMRIPLPLFSPQNHLPSPLSSSSQTLTTQE